MEVVGRDTFQGLLGGGTAAAKPYIGAVDDAHYEWRGRRMEQESHERNIKCFRRIKMPLSYRCTGVLVPVRTPNYSYV